MKLWEETGKIVPIGVKAVVLDKRGLDDDAELAEYLCEQDPGIYLIKHHSLWAYGDKSLIRTHHYYCVVWKETARLNKMENEETWYHTTLIGEEIFNLTLTAMGVKLYRDKPSREEFDA